MNRSLPGLRPPGPRDRFFGLSLAHRIRRNPPECLTEWGRSYGDICYFRLGPFHNFLLNHPELIHEVLVTKAKSFRKLRRHMRILHTFQGNGLVVSEGDLWLRQRRLLQPVFQPHRLEQYAQVAIDQTRQMLDRWSHGMEVEMVGEMTHLMLGVIAKTLFGVDIGDRARELRWAVRHVSESLFQDFGANVVLPDWVPLPYKRRKKAALRMLDDFVWSTIRQRRASGEQRDDFLSLILSAVDAAGEPGISERQAKDEAMTLFTAGHDSTSAALAWTAYLLATHPHEEAQLIKEIQAVLCDRAAVPGDLPRLEYTTMVVKESLRLYPPFWQLLFREATEDVTIADYLLPKGSWIYMVPFVTHRDPRFFDRPDDFLPERFAPGRIEQIPRHAYFPFGMGPHTCIGDRLAMIELTLIVATIYQRFRLTLAPGQGPAIPDPQFEMRPKHSLRMTLDGRNSPVPSEVGGLEK